MAPEVNISRIEDFANKVTSDAVFFGEMRKSDEHTITKRLMIRLLFKSYSQGIDAWCTGSSIKQHGELSRSASIDGGSEK